jgi:hypothetical protein
MKANPRLAADTYNRSRTNAYDAATHGVCGLLSRFKRPMVAMGSFNPDIRKTLSISPAVGDGFYVLLDKLSAGSHTLQFQVEEPGLGQNVTYHRTVPPVSTK